MLKRFDPEKSKDRNLLETHREKFIKSGPRTGLRDFNDLSRSGKWHRKNPGYSIYYQRTHLKEGREHTRKYYSKLKGMLFNLLGNKCASCGFLDSRALQIDHINGGGREERRMFETNRGNMNYARYYRYIIQKLEEGSEDYQVLCANCNAIKEVENREFSNRNAEKEV